MGPMQLSKRLTLIHLAALFLVFAATNWALTLKLLAVLGIVFSYLLAHPAVRVGWVFPKTLKPVQDARESRWFWSGFAIMVGVLALKEYGDPYYFTQNDTLMQYFPIIKGMFALMLEEPAMPVWSAYQGMGLPLTSGGYAMMYPPLYVAYGFARYVLNNVDLTMEVLAWMHFLPGYAVLYAAMRLLGVRPAIAVPMALCHGLAGYYFTQGRSWMAGFMLTLYIPALCYSLASFIRLPQGGVKWATQSGLMLGFFFYASHTEMWLYGMVLWGLSVVWITFCDLKIAWLRVRLVVLCLMLIGVLASPLGMIQIMEQQSVAPTDHDVGVHHDTFSMLVGSGMGWHTNPVYFFGGIPLLACAVFLFFGLVRLVKAPQSQPAMLMAFGLSALFCYLAMFGSEGWLWSAMKEFEPFSKFRWVWKWMPYFAAFSVMACAVFFEALMHGAGRKRLWMVRVLSVLAAALTFYNSFYAVEGGKRFSDQPYPLLAPELQSLQAREWKGTSVCRELTLGYNYSQEMNFLQTLSMNLATGYHVFAAHRYPQRVGMTPEYLAMRDLLEHDFGAYLKEYGICRVICTNAPYDYIRNDFHNVSCDGLKDSGQLSEEAQPLFGSRLYDVSDRQFKPLAYIADDESKTVEFKVRADGLDVFLPPSEYSYPYHVVLNFLYHPWMSAYMETGSRVGVSKDKFNRIKIQATPSMREIRLRLTPPWGNGLTCSAVLLIGVFGLMRHLKKTERA